MLFAKQTTESSRRYICKRRNQDREVSKKYSKPPLSWKAQPVGHADRRADHLRSPLKNPNATFVITKLETVLTFQIFQPRDPNRIRHFRRKIHLQLCRKSRLWKALDFVKFRNDHWSRTQEARSNLCVDWTSLLRERLFRLTLYIQMSGKQLQQAGAQTIQMMVFFRRALRA